MLWWLLGRVWCLSWKLGVEALCGGLVVVVVVGGDGVNDDKRDGGSGGKMKRYCGARVGYVRLVTRIERARGSMMGHAKICRGLCSRGLSTSGGEELYGS